MISTIKRYAKVYKILFRLSLEDLFAYRANFISRTLSHSIWAIFILVSMLLLTSRASSVFGWKAEELLVLAAMYNIVYSIFYFFFSRSFGEFSNTIHFGRLDGLLIKPIDSQFLMTCMYIDYTHAIRFVLGFSFLIFLLTHMHISVTIVTVLSFVIFLIFSVMILYSFWFSVMTLTVWFTKLSNLKDLLYEAHSFTRYPQEIYKGASMYVFFVLFPLTLIVVIPAKILLQKMFFGDFIWPVIFAAGMFYLSRKFWQFALRSYTSASG